MPCLRLSFENPDTSGFSGARICNVSEAWACHHPDLVTNIEAWLLFFIVFFFLNSNSMTEIKDKYIHISETWLEEPKMTLWHLRG